MERKIIKIPRNIKGYKLLKRVKTEKNDDRVVCIYQNKTGKKVVAKIWFGKRKNESYSFLKNEYNAYQVVRSILETKKLPSDIKSIQVPKVIGFVEEESSCILLVEYIEGRKGSTLEDSQIINNFLKIRKFIKYIGKNIPQSDKNKFSTRHWLRYLQYYIFTVILSIIKYPKYMDKIISGLVFVLTNTKTLIKDGSIGFVHGDLNFDNYIVDFEGNIYLIDFEFSKFTYMESELASLLRYCKIRGKLYREFRKYISSSNQNDRNRESLIKVFSIMYATQGLISTNSSESEITSTYNFLTDSL